MKDFLNELKHKAGRKAASSGQQLAWKIMKKKTFTIYKRKIHSLRILDVNIIDDTFD